ncbi:aminotransferase class IV [Duncaniella sp.]|uniref:aminotransferase class IV n=1 Tax=Duncaniella sp. TaxID=2518496 RepID=UPI0023C0E6A7|nr:aminotransferase class IV [Duncaniella sp.]MDE5904389.1 aminotransferase class IV [Duncaniella sp.]MDE7147441.1 aminotransferase class IV [Duncaniella sp.]
MTLNNPLFIETIRWSDGKFHLLELHGRRMERTRLEVFGSACVVPDMSWLPPVPENLKNRTVKCRVRYGREIHSVEFEPYTPRKIESLKLVDGGNIDYHLKYSDRSALTDLAEMRGDADEVIIVKDGFITDTSYSNLVFAAGERFLTSDRQLLRGVMLSHLLESGKVSAVALRPDDILPGNRYGITCAFMVNAMLPIESAKPIDIRNIIR